MTMAFLYDSSRNLVFYGYNWDSTNNSAYSDLSPTQLDQLLPLRPKIAHYTEIMRGRSVLRRYLVQSGAVMVKLCII